MSNIQSATLILRTADLSATADQYGLRDTAITTMTWNNINLRSLLGDMYDKYDSFNLCLNSVVSSPYNSNMQTNDRSVILNLSGLPFLNQTYNVPSQTNTNTTPIAILNFPYYTTPVTASLVQYFYSNNVSTFTKTFNTVNLTLQYQKIYDNSALASNYPNMCFLFEIIGIPK